MVRLNKILTYLSDIIKKPSFKPVIGFADNLKLSMTDCLLAVKTILSVIIGVLTTTEHYKLTKSIQNGCNSEPNTVCTPTNQYMFTGLHKSPTTLANVSSLSDDIKLSIISEPESKIGNTTNEPGTHQTVAKPNRHDPKV